MRVDYLTENMTTTYSLKAAHDQEHILSRPAEEPGGVCRSCRHPAQRDRTEHDKPPDGKPDQDINMNEHVGLHEHVI